MSRAPPCWKAAPHSCTLCTCAPSRALGPAPGTSCHHDGTRRVPSPQPRAGPATGGLGNKRLKKSDNFSPQLDLIFFFDAPTAGGRIAGEKQVRQEKVRLWSEGPRSAGFPGAARTLSAPGIGVYSALTAKLMTARDPSRCSSGPSRPRVPEVNTHREKREEPSKNPFENTSTFMYICSRARWKMGLVLRRRRRRLLPGTLHSLRLWGPSSLGLGLALAMVGTGAHGACPLKCLLWASRAQLLCSPADVPPTAVSYICAFQNLAPILTWLLLFSSPVW